MLTDRYELPLSTALSAARDAYVEGCAAKLTMYPGAIAAFDRAIAADPAFALAHAAKAHALLERGDAAAARAVIAAAQSLIAGLSAREVSHVAFFALLAAGDSEAALAALPVHLSAWPRDALVLGTAAFTNGLIGSSGRAGQKRALLALLDGLAASYGDDWWFTAHHGMALSENGQRDAASPRSPVPSRKTRAIPGRRMPTPTSATRRAMPMQPASSWRPGSPPIRVAGRYTAT
jgi:tetratricopeptide (TPR) repeat protein